jgi:uncharacterized protein (DUF2062 family)
MKKRLSKRKASVLTIRQSVLRFSRYWYLRLVRLQGHPHQIARGVAVGTFSGLFPWFGLQMIIALLLAVLVRGNKIAAVAMTWISNPITNFPIFVFNYKVGEWILGSNSSTKFTGNLQSVQDIKDLGLNVFITVFFGSFWVGLLAGIISYFLSLKIIHRSRKIRRFR